MSFLNWIVEDLNSVSGFFYEIYYEVLDWPWPFWYAAGFFYDLSRVFNWLAWDFSDFGSWVLDTVDRLRDILSWSNIRSLIRGWLPDLEDVVDWFNRWWVWVGQEIDAWWSSASLTVQGWIDTATQGFTELVTAWDSFLNITWPQWTGELDTLKADWDTFWTVTLPGLLSQIDLDTWWTDRQADIQGFIETTIETWIPDWESISQLWSGVAEFITDPLTWLETKFTDWFLGPEV